jgi:DUF1680 family protein
VVHNSSIYFQTKDGLTVAQYIPSDLTWDYQGVPVKVTQVFDRQKEQTRRPNSDAYEFTVSAEKPVEFAMSFRLPWWISGDVQVTVNGEPVRVDSKPSSYFTIKREWKDDKVRVILPKKLYVSALPDNPDTVAFMDGPAVLVGLVDEERMLVGDKNNPETILTPDAERQWGMWNQSRYRTTNQERGIRFVPLYEVKDETYTMYFPVKKG